MQRKLWRFVCSCAKRVMCRLTNTESYKLSYGIQFIIKLCACKIQIVRLVIILLHIFIELIHFFYDNTQGMSISRNNGEVNEHQCQSNNYWNTLYENVRVLCAEFLFIFCACIYACVCCSCSIHKEQYLL